MALRVPARCVGGQRCAPKNHKALGIGTACYGLIVGCLPFLAGLALATGPLRTAAAQGAVTWSEPFNVSNSPTSSLHPVVVADSYGNIHVFWSEDIDGGAIRAGQRLESGNTVQYRRWDGRTWTEQRDILAVARDPLADFMAVVVDNTNLLHLVWTGLTNLYYSSAPATEADSPWAWSTPMIFSVDSARAQWESDVAVDSHGNVHVAYAEGGSNPGVLHIMAVPDAGIWTQPVRISDPLRPMEDAFRAVRLVVDPSDRLHAVWSTVNTNGYDQAVYYARSEGPGNAWEPPMLMEDASIDTGFTGFPSLLAYAEDELILVHVGQAHLGRVERTSVDGGKTWSEPRTIIPSMEGVNGFLIPLTDGFGGLHLVINMRPSADQRVGIYYAPRAGLDWSPISLVAAESPYASSAHYTDAAVRLGNEIHIVWTQLSTGEIWYVRGQILGVPQALAQPLPTQVPVATPGAAATPLNAETAVTRSPDFGATAPPEQSSFSPVLLGGLASAVVVLCGLLWMRARSR
jgi:hypothetical protein